MTKQQLIKKAYLELFKENDSDKEKRFAAIEKWIDENGWFSGVLHNVSEELLDKGWHEVRPKSISGIEHNNGWIKIKDENDLPKEIVECFFVNYDIMRISSLLFIPNTNSTVFFLSKFTHYQPIKKPKNPLY